METPLWKVAIIFIVMMLLVWKFNVGISLKWKMLFTVAVAIALALKFGVGFDLKGFTGRKN